MSRLLRLAPLWVVLLACLAYGNVIPGAFHLDDFHVVERNPYIRTLDNIPRFFVDTTTFTDIVANRDYRPLMMTGFAVIYQIGELNPLPFHVWSLLLHTLAALVMFYLVRGILLWTDSQELGVPTRATATAAALTAAALFAVHTLMSESVNYVNGQAVLLVTLFCLLATLAYARLVAAAEEGLPRSRLLLLGLAGVLAQCGALCSKPTAITLPVLLLLYDLLFAAPAASRAEVWRGRLMRIAPFLAVNCAYLIFRVQTMAAPFGGEPAHGYLVNALTQSRVLTFYYLRHFLWPRGLSIDPNINISSSVREPEVLAALGVLAILAVAVLLTWRRFRITALCAAWWVIALLPVTYLKALEQPASEHRMYLPMFGLVVPVALLVVGLLMRTDHRGWRRLGITLTILVVAALVVNSQLRNRIWQSKLLLWQDAAAQSGEWRPHMNYALALESAGRSDEALAEFEAAVMAASYSRPHTNLGLAYLRRGRVEEGMRELEYGVQLWPELGEAHFYLGYGCETIGELERGLSEYRLAITHNPTLLAAHYRLGDLSWRLGDLTAARSAYDRILELAPDEARARRSLALLKQPGATPPAGETAPPPAGSPPDSPDPPGDAMPGPGSGIMQGGGFRLAVSPLTTAAPHRGVLRGDATSAAPDGSGVVDSLFAAGFAHQQAARREAAIAAYEQLLDLDPDHVQVLFNLGYALIETGDVSRAGQAIVLLERAQILQPSYAEILFHLGQGHELLAGAGPPAADSTAALTRAIDYYRRYLDATDTHPGLEQQAAQRITALEAVSPR